VNDRKRRISGLKLSLPSLAINRVKSSSNNFDKDLILFHIRHSNIGVQLQNIHTPIFPINPGLHLRRHSCQFHSLRRSRCSSLSLYQHSCRPCWKGGLQWSNWGSFFPESEGKSERKWRSGREWRRKGSEAWSCGGEWSTQRHVYKSLHTYLCLNQPPFGSVISLVFCLVH